MFLDTACYGHGSVYLYPGPAQDKAQTCVISPCDQVPLSIRASGYSCCCGRFDKGDVAPVDDKHLIVKCFGADQKCGLKRGRFLSCMEHSANFISQCTFIAPIVAKPKGGRLIFVLVLSTETLEQLAPVLP